MPGEWAYPVKNLRPDGTVFFSLGRDPLHAGDFVAVAMGGIDVRAAYVVIVEGRLLLKPVGEPMFWDAEFSMYSGLILLPRPGGDDVEPR